MRKFVGVSCLVAFVAVCLVGFLATDTVEARPQYIKQFVAMYPALESQAKTGAKCKICHPGDQKKEQNAYSAIVLEHLGKPNVRDVVVIDAALTEAAKGDSGNGKTFGELLTAGELPVPVED